MRAAVLTGPGRLGLDEVDDPVAAPGEAIVRVTGCGICGSDLHAISMVAPQGSVLGHEIAGVVDTVGPGGDETLVGRQVAVRPFTGCGSCHWCVSGRADHCTGFGLVGMERPGGFAELVAVGADELFALPAAVTPEEQALIEPLAVARRALRRGGDARDESVLVLGAGPIGLAVVAWARRLGARAIVASDPSAVRRDLALALGADDAVDPLTDDVAEVAHRAGGGAAPTVTFECSGRQGLIADAMGLTAVDGRVVVVGICPSEDTFVPFVGLMKELDLRFAVYYGREDFLDTIEAAGEAPLAAAMVTEVIGLDALPERFTRLARDADAGKVVVDPSR